jgi:CubicO group peptidase (beta-lactamase class C family)
MHIPGMAIAVVKDDEVILARGFGLADLENETPVTPETIFAIGSATKAFTAMLVGMLVDDGKMGWDDPVTEHIPYFALNVDSDDENAQVTIRDMLSHRTGFARMGVLIASGAVPRGEVLRAATRAEPWVGLREKWYYSKTSCTPLPGSRWATPQAPIGTRWWPSGYSSHWA